MLFITLLLLCIFLVCIFFVIYLPGYLLLSKVHKDINDSETISLSLSVGIVLLVILGVVLGLTSLRYLLLPILLILAFISFVKFKRILIKPWCLFTKNKLLLTIILLGILIQGFISFPSGYQYREGLLFWSSQGFDGFWHISIMEEIKKGFPPQIPGFAGEKLVNYHYLSDILMGEVARIFPFFSSLDLYFRFFPVLFSFLMGISVFSFVQRWQNKRVAYWALFFTYFTGSFGYIVTFIKNRQLFGGETAFWAAQLNTVIANPPHAVAISLILASLVSVLLYLETRTKSIIPILILTGLSVAGFKVSGGVILLTGLTVIGVMDLIFKRKITLLLLSFVLGFSNFATIKLMTRGVEEYLIFSPWWFIRTMIVEKLGLIDWEWKRQHYLSKGTWHAYLRVMQLETYGFLIFFIGNAGMRIIGVLEIIRKLLFNKKFIYKEPFTIGLFCMIAFSLLIPLLFLQKGIVFNSIQFMQYFLLFLGFYAAITTDRILQLIESRLIKLVIILAVVIFSLPTVIGNLVEFYGPDRSPLAMISNSELEALDYLKDNSDQTDIILTPVFKGLAFNRYLEEKYNKLPIPIYLWNSTNYISGLTERRTFLSSKDMVIQTGFNYESRFNQVKEFFNQEDYEGNVKFLKEYGIKYIYVPEDSISSSLDIEKNNLSIFFKNSAAVIYQFKEGD